MSRTPMFLELASMAQALLRARGNHAPEAVEVVGTVLLVSDLVQRGTGPKVNGYQRQAAVAEVCRRMILARCPNCGVSGFDTVSGRCAQAFQCCGGVS